MSVSMDSVEIGPYKDRSRGQSRFSCVDTSPSTSIALALEFENRLLQESNHDFFIADC